MYGHGSYAGHVNWAVEIILVRMGLATSEK